MYEMFVSCSHICVILSYVSGAHMIIYQSIQCALDKNI